MFKKLHVISTKILKSLQNTKESIQSDLANMTLSILKSIFAVLHIARICRTALVDPPNNVIKRTAFSIDFLVIISLGLISFFIRLIIDLDIVSFSFNLSILISLHVLSCSEEFNL